MPSSGSRVSSRRFVAGGVCVRSIYLSLPKVMHYRDEGGSGRSRRTVQRHPLTASPFSYRLISSPHPNLPHLTPTNLTSPHPNSLHLYALPGLLSLTDVRYVVVDEADTLLEKDFGEQVRTFLSQLNVCVPWREKHLINSLSRSHALTHSHPRPLTHSHSQRKPNPRLPLQLIFTSATIPKSLNDYIDREFPVRCPG